MDPECQQTLWALTLEHYQTAGRLTARQIEDQLIDAVLDWDAAHHTLTFCKVWRQHEIARVGVL